MQQVTKPTKERSIQGRASVEMQIAANRRSIKQATGLTRAELADVEKYLAMKRKRPRIGLADVARVLGVHRSVITRTFKKAEAAGLLLRIGRTFIANVRDVLRMAAEGLKHRAKHLQRQYVGKLQRARALQRKGKSGSVAALSTHSERDIIQSADDLSDAELERIGTPWAFDLLSKRWQNA